MGKTKKTKLYFQLGDKKKKRIAKIKQDTPGRLFLYENGNEKTIWEGLVDITEPIPENQKPIVYAGEDIFVKPDTGVILDGTATDSDGTIASVVWSQVSGPTVALIPDPEDITKASFTSTAIGDVLEFQLEATDDKGAISKDTVKVTVNETGEPPEEPEPQPGQLLYDSNTDIDWGGLGGQVKKVTDTYGDQSAYGKGFHMQASGNPRMYLDPATKILTLEHDGKYGRAYFHVPNYQSRLECEFMLDSCSNGASFKTRNRHQYGEEVDQNAPTKDKQGGQGCGIHCDEVSNDLEIMHGTEEGGPHSALSPKLEANKWISLKFSQYDKDGKIHVVTELDGKIVNEGDVKAPAQFFDRAKFEEWSEFWVRLNADSGGQLKVRNLKVYSL